MESPLETFLYKRDEYWHEITTRITNVTELTNKFVDGLLKMTYEFRRALQMSTPEHIAIEELNPNFTEYDDEWISSIIDRWLEHYHVHGDDYFDYLIEGQDDDDEERDYGNAVRQDIDIFTENIIRLYRTRLNPQQ